MLAVSCIVPTHRSGRWARNPVRRILAITTCYGPGWICAFLEQYSHEPNIAVARAWLHVFGLEMTGERSLALETQRKLGQDALGVMEGHLRQNDYFVGGRYTVADIALYAYTHVAHEGGFDLAGYPAVRAWMGRVASQPDHIPITQG